MKNSEYRMAVVKVAEELKQGHPVALFTKMVEAAGGWEAYVRAAAEAARTKDIAAFKRSARDAALNGFSAQLELPGLGHGTLPPFVYRKHEDGEEYAVPWHEGTLDEQDAEVRLLERRLAVMRRVVEGYRRTINRLRELGVSGSTTGAEIQEMFPREIEE